MTITIYEIPLTAKPQKLQVTLGTTPYNLIVKWNTVFTTWVMDITYTSENAVLSGIPLITGADLLAQYSYLNFGGALYVQTDNNASAIPTYTNLGSNSHLYFVVTS